ncbi:hypothetical protein [Pedobacter gandavensis]|uniref:Uncharacterized protein n=1 Tax=Pedobacter gandavensis TaxID=2679963 RepID=A0ABR6EYQ0_9SPHI|nr:hypothetical protein [Pedobacter gandavensis]MBB2150147.1 hypothetical protein [Pedobacter gandavensis]
MKKIMMLFSATLLLSSCSRYYVSTLESSTARKSEETGVFTFENDTLAVTYNFNGKNAPVSIEMYNKLNEPLYIDWQKSALIKGDKAVSFLGREVSIKADISGYSMNFSNEKAFNDLRFHDSALKGSAELPEVISFIPPKSRISRTLLKLAEAHNYKSLPDSVYKKSFISLNDRPGIWAKAATFSPQNSPLSFKSYLTIFTEQEDKRKNFSLVQDFYLSTLVKSFVNPKSMTSVEQKPGNIFYNSESTGYGKTMTGVAIGAIVMVGAAAESSLPVSK